MPRMTRTNARKFQKGFSLGEVLLSIAVLVVGILPVFASISRGLKVSVDDQHIIVGSGLAQEGVELIQNIRDNRVLSDEAFSGWLPSGSTWNDCRIDFDDDVVDDPDSAGIDCGVSGEYGYDLSRIPSGSSEGMFTHTNTQGQYRRRIFLEYDASEERLAVISAVYWGEEEYADGDDVHDRCTAGNRCVFAETVLTAWR